MLANKLLTIFNLLSSILQLCRWRNSGLSPWVGLLLNMMKIGDVDQGERNMLLVFSFWFSIHMLFIAIEETG